GTLPRDRSTPSRGPRHELCTRYCALKGSFTQTRMAAVECHRISVFGHGFTSIQLEITLVAANVNLVGTNRLLDRARVLVRVRAVWKATVTDIRAKLWKIGFELTRLNPPKFELSQTRRVDNVTARIEPDEFGGRRCVASLVGPIRHLGNGKPKS